jgi:hypothetical protein
VDKASVSGRGRLLLYLASAADPRRFAVGPALAAAAGRSGWRFECYYDALRKGRHFGGGDPAGAQPGWPNGSLVAGGRHADHIRWLAAQFDICALGDPAALLWPVLDQLKVEVLTRSNDPTELYRAGFERLSEPLPRRALLLDAAPQGSRGLLVAPYLYPAFFVGEPALGVVEHDALGAERLEEVSVDVGDRDYADVTAELAERHGGWGEGVLLGDPDLVASQLGRAAALRLLPLYGRPQTGVIARAGPTLSRAREPVFGRQYDDHDFFELARHGRGLQVIDPGPPFEAARGTQPPVPQAPEPDDDQLERWAREGRVLSTLLLWCGMVRELDCLPRLVDLVAETGVAGGLVTTVELVELAGDSALFLLGVPPERGGVQGLLEPLLGSTGRGVAAEALLPEGGLEASLTAARERFPVDGWWPLLDTPLAPARPPRVAWRAGRPALLFEPRGDGSETTSAEPRRPDFRSLAGAAVRATPLERLFERRRPFDDARPGTLSPPVADAVRAAGFGYMWTKAGFGRPRIPFRDGDFVALTLTAGNWDGWSPFYTLGSARDLKLAERRLRRDNRPGWLVGTIDSPLWALSGEVLERGAELYRIAELTARGGASGRLVNVTPRVVARYARLLDRLGLLT